MRLRMIGRPAAAPALAGCVLVMAACSSSEPAKPALTYPATTMGDVVDDYGGTKVPDPYRWMESLDSPEVKAWITAQNAVTDPYLEGLPRRKALNERLTALWDYPRVGLPTIEGGRMFYAKNSGLQRQAPVYSRTSVDAPPSLVIDPNAISEDGSVALAEYKVSPDTKLMAYGLSEGGADWETIHVRDLTTGADLQDEVRWKRFSPISWTRDSKGFFYSRYPEPPNGKVLEAALSGHTLYYHQVGTPQSQDVLVYERKDLAGWIINGTVTEDGRYLLVMMAEGSGNKNRLYAADLGNPVTPNLKAPIEPVIEDDDAEFAPIGNKGSVVFLRSDRKAPNRQVIALDLRNPAPAGWKTIVPEQPQALETVGVIGGLVVAQYLVDVQSKLRLFDLDGGDRGEIALPGIGTVGALSGREDTPGVWYTFTSPLSPSTVYRYDPETKKSTAFEPPPLPIDLGGYETTAMFASSKDGTKVPYFMTAKKGLARDGNNPTMIYGYGGFSISTLPTYRQDVPAWLEMGGVWVTAAMRGGAEYGEKWHQAGMLDLKQNVFDDFIAVAEHLVSEKISSPKKLGVMGGSNGGLLVGAVVNQRPDLYAVAMPAVGVMDMLRYDRFTGGRLWVQEYGSSQNAAQFPFLIKYSPVQNVKKGVCYPATLITTADHDDRVVPSHSFKYAAAMQAAQGCANPILIRVEVSGSHGYRPTDKLIAERADQWAFAASAMGIR